MMLRNFRGNSKKNAIRHLPSSDIQDVRSVTDHLLARDHAERHGWRVIAEYSDGGPRGSGCENLPGLLGLMAAENDSASTWC
jgi:hypothetical protein